MPNADTRTNTHSHDHGTVIAHVTRGEHIIPRASAHALTHPHHDTHPRGETP
jgi:hypothetical protein